MPITDCKIHGDTACPEMCEHLKQDLENGVYSPFFTLPVMTIRMCTSCFQVYKVQDILEKVSIDKESIVELRNQTKGIYNIAPNYYFEKKILDEENPIILKEIESVYHKINEKSGFECQKCIDKIELEHARNNNLELPFEPFENTILHERDKRLFKVEELINAYIEKKGKLLPDSTKTYQKTRACSTYGGSVKQPATVLIYGFTSKNDQDELLTIINEFFESTSKPQRKIMFYDSLNWIIKYRESEGIIRSKTRDKVTLLSDITIK